ncbi:MAG: LysM peptidoglycan-binding domain-containing protein [Desulfobacterota bacterium]|nr:LysM peptidoglycan-binding domain-containing protein [Thermodesulfobacteriota bacterium]
MQAKLYARTIVFLLLCSVYVSGCAENSQVRYRPVCSGSGGLSTGSEAGISSNSPQARLEAALSQCQTSQELWEAGEVERAIAALDAAYAFLLDIPSDAEPAILRQKEDLRHIIAQRIIKMRATRLNAVNGSHKAIPLEMNEYVTQAIASFQTRERNLFLEAYARSGKYRPMIVKALQEEGMPEELSWLPFIESGFKVNVCSPARALGLWQFIASTGYKFGLERNEWIDERLDPFKSTKAAIAYLKELHAMFGDWSTALAAYNCGESIVLKAIRTQRVNYLDNFWDLYRRLPCETASFYPRFLAVLHIVQSPEKYGFTLPALQQCIEVEEVDIDRQVHLQTIADALGISFEQLKELNPELRKEVTPPAPYGLKVPNGSARKLMARLADIPLWTPPVPGYTVHKVKKGDTISSLAARYRTTKHAIAALNNMSQTQPLVEGTRLKIPTEKRGSAELEKPLRISSALKDNMVEHVVQEGETLWDIAKRYNTTAKNIQALNRLATTDLVVGQVLSVLENPGALKQSRIIKYTAQKGDSPYIIAKKHRMKLDEFLKLNKLAKDARLMPGDTLLVRVR